MIEELKTQAADYKETSSPYSLTKLYELLESGPLTFTTYFNNTNGTQKVEAKGYNFSGTFREFPKSNEYPTPDLLEVTKDRGEIIFVQLSDLIEP